MKSQKEWKSLHGHRRSNLDLVNKLYSSPVKIEFIKIEEAYIAKLMYALKELKSEVKVYYEHDQLLLEETDAFIKVCRKVVGTLRSYSTYFKENNDLIVKYFTLTQKRIYTDLFKKNVEPIVDLIRVLRKQENNAYIDALSKLIVEKNTSPNNICILTKEKFLGGYIEVNRMKYPVMTDKEFVSLGVFTDIVVFLGTPSYFDSKFSKIFYGNQIIFFGYSCFENQLAKSRSFLDLINHNYLINTIYKNVTFAKGFPGLDFKENFTKEIINKSEKTIINHFENIPLENKVEVKLATISRNKYIFLPIRQKVNVIDRDSLKVFQEEVKGLSVGDLLIFREQNASNLVREEADNIMGANADKYRESLEKWKKRLRYNVRKKGVETVSKILRGRYKISVAKENNIKNWMSNNSIKPSCLNELLKALKFNPQEITEILNAATEIRSAHISAGRHISHTLMDELDKDLENVINENELYKFESKEFEGAFFNITEIKRISDKTYFIPENEMLKIING